MIDRLDLHRAATGGAAVGVGADLEQVPGLPAAGGGGRLDRQLRRVRQLHRQPRGVRGDAQLAWRRRVRSVEGGGGRRLAGPDAHRGRLTGGRGAVGQDPHGHRRGVAAAAVGVTGRQIGAGHPGPVRAGHEAHPRAVHLDRPVGGGRGIDQLQAVAAGRGLIGVADGEDEPGTGLGSGTGQGDRGELGAIGGRRHPDGVFRLVTAAVGVAGAQAKGRIAVPVRLRAKARPVRAIQFQLAAGRGGDDDQRHRWPVREVRGQGHPRAQGVLGGLQGDRHQLRHGVRVRRREGAHQEQQQGRVTALHGVRDFFAGWRPGSP